MKGAISNYERLFVGYELHLGGGSPASRSGDDGLVSRRRRSSLISKRAHFGRDSERDSIFVTEQTENIARELVEQRAESAFLGKDLSSRQRDSGSLGVISGNCEEKRAKFVNDRRFTGGDCDSI